MKVFLSFLQSHSNHSIASYSFWEYYIKNGIDESKNEWIECKEIDWAFGLVDQSSEYFNIWKSNCWQRTIDFLKKNPVDLFLSYLYPHMVDDTAIREIQRLGIPCVNFFCDNIRMFRSIPKVYNVFDLHWVPEYRALSMYQNAGMPSIHLPMPMWVERSNRTIKEECFEQISFIGSFDIQRKIFFENIVEINNKLPFLIYGHGWEVEENKQFARNYSLVKKLRFQFDCIMQDGLLAYVRKIQQRNVDLSVSAVLIDHIKGRLSFVDYIKISQQSMITTGVNRYPSFRFPLHNPDRYSRLRDIEAPMLGCCYLTEWTDGIDLLYDLDSEIKVYHTPEEFVSQSERLIHDVQLRKKLRVNGQIRALEDHSITSSLSKIKTRLSLN